MLPPRARRSSFHHCVAGLCLLAGLSAVLPMPVALGQEATSGTKPVSPATTISAQSEWERLFYVPYRNLKEVFEKEGSAVFMPYGQFLKFWERVPRVDLNDPASPPLSAVITSAAYSGRVEKDLARIDAELTIQVLGKAWVELPLRYGEAAIGRMTASDDKVLLYGTAPGAYALLFPKAGEHKVKLELTARVRNSPDGRSLEVEGPTAGITTFELSVPVGDQTIDVLPNGVVTAASTDEKSTVVKANLGAAPKIIARWRPRVSTAPVMEVLTSVHNAIDVRIADGLVHTVATLKYSVLRGQVDQVRIGVPLDHRILDVTADGLKSWKATREEKSQVLTVSLLGGEARSIAIEVRTEHAAPTGPFPPAGIDDAGIYHGIHAIDEVRENGVLRIVHGPELSLSAEQQSGLVRVEAAPESGAAASGDSLSYNFYSPKFRLLVTARPVEPRLLVAHRTQLVYRDDELQSTARLDYAVERAGVFELRFKLPAGFKVDRVDCEPMKEFQAPEGTDELIVSFREKTLGKIAIVVTGHLPLDLADKEARLLPLLEPQQVAREDGLVTVYAPESLEVIADDKGIEGAQPTRIDPTQSSPLPNVRLVSAWTYTRQPKIAIRTERKPTRLAAAVATSITLRPELVEVSTRLSYAVAFAPIDTFRFAVPEAIAESVQVETIDAAATPIKQKSRAEKAEAGWIAWTVVLQRPTTGVVSFRVRYDVKPETQGAQAVASIEPLRVLETPGVGEGAAPVVPASVSGEITIEKDRSLSIASKGDGFEPIDVRELTLLPASGYLAYRYYKQPEKLETPFALELTATRSEVQPVVETVVGQALVEAVVTEDKSATYRCRYRLKTSARQRLAIDLPQDAEILDTLVAGQRVDLEKGEDTGSKDWDAFKVNVARATPSDQAFVLALVFRVPFKDVPLKGPGGNIKLPLPRIGGGEAKSTVAIQQLRTVVWIPAKFSLVGIPEGFNPDRSTYLTPSQGAVAFAATTDHVENWFGDSASGLFAFTPSGKAYVYHRLGTADVVEASYWRTAWFTWTISGAILVIALVLVHTSWENRLTIVLLAAFGASLHALVDADLVMNLLGAARFGLLAMVAYWLLHALTRPRSATAGITFRPIEPATAVSALGTVIPPPGVFEVKAEE